MDLVGETGIDVSEWERSKRGASNPKYCYEWSFAQAGKVVVLCLWFEHLEDKHGAIWSRPTPLRELLHLEPIQVARAKRFVEAIQMSQREGVPIRAIVSTGSIRDLENANAAPSRVRKRMLDPISWWVSSYDPDTGQYTLIRGLKPARVVDQFDLELEHQRRTTVRETIVRSADVRRRALERSGGKCEWCR